MGNASQTTGVRLNRKKIQENFESQVDSQQVDPNNDLRDEEFNEDSELNLSEMKMEGVVNDVKKPERVSQARDGVRKRKSSRSGRNVRKKYGLNNKDLFYQLTDTLLLFKNTPIKYSRNQKFTCCNCSTKVQGTDYDSFQQLRTHILNCHSKTRMDSSMSEKRQSCPICSEKIDKGSALRSHIFSCHRPSVAVCESCWKPLKPNSMPTHAWLHKNPEEKTDYVASGGLDLARCKSKYQQKYSQRLICKTCGKQCQTRTHLRRHEDTHLPKDLREQFLCPDCGVQLLSKQSLDSHMSTRHLKPNSNNPPVMRRSLVCPICSQRFNWSMKTRYKSHLRSHTGERPFQCDLCGKSFFSQKHLQVHLYVHSELRAYQCEFCTMSYKHERNLIRHRKTAHKHMIPQTFFISSGKTGFIGPKIAFPCDLCNKVFELKCRLDKHIRTNHLDKAMDMHVRT